MPVIKGIDYYGILELSPNAEDREVKEAYYRLGLLYNSKRLTNPKHATKFVLVGEAYEVLTDPLLRKIYDTYGEMGLMHGIQTPVGWHPPFVYHGDPVRTFREFFGTESPYADLIEFVRKCEDMVPIKAGGGFKSRKNPIINSLPLTLEEIYSGTYKKMKITRSVFKDDGEQKMEKREQILPIEIKPGIPEGTEIIFQNIGDEGPTELPADVIYVIKDLPHKVYKRIGIDLHMNQTVNLNQALNGLTLKIKTLDGREMKTRIIEVINPNYKKIILGEGMPLADDPMTYGNMVINFSVEFPLYIPTLSKKIVDKGLSEAKEIEYMLFENEKTAETEESKKTLRDPSKACLN